MLQMLLPWSKKQSPRPRKSLRAGPVWSWVVALAFRRVYPVPVWNVRRKMFVDDCFPTTFPYQIPSQIQPTCCSWCWTLESWQLVATQPIKQVLSCCTFGCYRLCFGYGAIDLGPGFGFLGRLVKNILCCWKIEGSEGRFYGCFPFRHIVAVCQCMLQLTWQFRNCIVFVFMNWYIKESHVPIATQGCITASKCTDATPAGPAANSLWRTRPVSMTWMWKSMTFDHNFCKHWWKKLGGSKLLYIAVVTSGFWMLHLCSSFLFPPESGVSGLSTPRWVNSFSQLW